MAARPSLTKEDAAVVLPVWNEHIDKLGDGKPIDRPKLFAAMTIGKKLEDFIASTDAPEASGAATDPKPRKKTSKADPNQS
jgi:hypothetical protein